VNRIAARARHLNTFTESFLLFLVASGRRCRRPWCSAPCRRTIPTSVAAPPVSGPANLCGEARTPRVLPLRDERLPERYSGVRLRALCTVLHLRLSPLGRNEAESNMRGLGCPARSGVQRLSTQQYARAQVDGANVRHAISSFIFISTGRTSGARSYRTSSP
jgi:hypothetical protein